MTRPDELVSILDRILDGCGDERDVAILRQSLKASSGQNVVQLGKYNVNIGEGKDIHIGDKVYQGADAQTIRSILLEVLSQNTRQLEIDWHNISQAMLSEQQRLTTNPLTSGEGITYRTEQVYVPLGLVERKKQTRRREDVSPEQGSELYRETEITQTFEHQQFLEQVLRHRQSPKSQGRRIAIIGEPGAGKTTLLQQIAQWVSLEMAQSVVIWVSLADLQGRELESYLLEVWLQAVARKVGQAEASTQIQDDFVAQFNQGLVWLLLDGVDEMQATVGNPLGEIERQIRTGTLLQQARIVLSCRLNLWDGGSNALDSFDNYRTLEFSYPQQVEQFIRNWFGSLPSAETQTGQRLCAALRESGKERIRDLVKNPLRLTLLCFNWYLGEGKLPQTKAGLYEQFVGDFYEWKKGQFATTGEQRKRLNAALGELAREAIDKEATRFRLRQEFVREYLGEPDDADSLFGFALRLGWLNKVGVEAENPRKGVYAFFHPTFQEYFAALGIEDSEYFLNHVLENPNHPYANYRIFESQWKEVFLLWLGRNDIRISVTDKNRLIQSLKDFKDGMEIIVGRSKSMLAIYEYMALFLAIEGIAEFSDCYYSDEIISLGFELGFGIFDESKLFYKNMSIQKRVKLALNRSSKSKVFNATIKWLEKLKEKLESGQYSILESRHNSIRDPYFQVSFRGLMDNLEEDRFAKESSLYLLFGILIKIRFYPDENFRWLIYLSALKLSNHSKIVIHELIKLFERDLEEKPFELQNSQDKDLSWHIINLLIIIDPCSIDSKILGKFFEYFEFNCFKEIYLSNHILMGIKTLGRLLPKGHERAVNILVKILEGEVLKEEIEALTKWQQELICENALISLWHHEAGHETAIRAFCRLKQVNELQSIKEIEELYQTYCYINYFYSESNEQETDEIYQLYAGDPGDGSGNIYEEVNLIKQSLSKEELMKTVRQQKISLQNPDIWLGYHEDQDYFSAIYELLYHCAENMPYREFYEALCY